MVMKGISVAFKKLGAWLGRTNNTVYQAATDGTVCAYNSTTALEVEGLTDINNPPTIARQKDSADPVGYAACISMPVRKNDYWKVENATTVFWIPLEP